MSEKYVDEKELRDELLKSQANGNVPTDRLCELFLLMVSRFLTKRSYSGYSADVKEDIQAECSVKFMRMLHNFKATLPDGRKSNAFSWMTNLIEHRALEVIAKAKRDWARRREYEERMRDAMLAELPVKP